MAHITLEHPCDQVDLQMALKHVFRFADKVTENTFKAWKIKQLNAFLMLGPD